MVCLRVLELTFCMHFLYLSIMLVTCSNHLILLDLFIYTYFYCNVKLGKIRCNITLKFGFIFLH